MQTVGICGTDIHFWKKGRAGDYVIKSPMLLGHEPSGIVAALGEGVTSLKVGGYMVVYHVNVNFSDAFLPENLWKKRCSRGTQLFPVSPELPGNCTIFTTFQSFLGPQF